MSARFDKVDGLILDTARVRHNNIDYVFAVGNKNTSLTELEELMGVKLSNNMELTKAIKNSSVYQGLYLIKDTRLYRLDFYSKDIISNALCLVKKDVDLEVINKAFKVFQRELFKRG